MRLCYGLFLAFLVACGSDGTSSPSGNPPAPPPPPPVVANVDMTDNGGLQPYAFSPATLSVKVGTTVAWTNSGKTSHTTTSDATGWNSGTVSPAGNIPCDPTDPYCTPGTTPPGKYERTFNTAGTYQYHCAFHQLQGMTGTITVTP